MAWSETQQWLADEQSDFLDKIPVIRAFVNSPDSNAHTVVRSDVAETFNVEFESMAEAVEACHELHEATVEKPWFDDPTVGRDAIENLSSETVESIQQEINSCKRAIRDSVSSALQRHDVQHVPPVDDDLWPSYLTRSELERL